MTDSERRAYESLERNRDYYKIMYGHASQTAQELLIENEKLQMEIELLESIIDQLQSSYLDDDYYDAYDDYDEDGYDEWFSDEEDEEDDFIEAQEQWIQLEMEVNDGE